MTRRTAAALVALALAHLGCGKTGQGSSSDAGGSANANAGGESAVAQGGAGGDDVPLNCPAVHPGPSPLSRLGTRELNRSFSAFPPKSRAQISNWLDESGWADDPRGDVTSVYVERVHQLAHDVSQIMTFDGNDEHWLRGCDVVSQGDDACRDTLMEPFLERAYRRVITDEDRDEMKLVFAEGKRIGGDFASGMRAIVEVALQSPDFMYLLEQGNGQQAGDAVQLTGFETAARLSYFLIGGPPDAELFGIARLGPLEPAALATQASRLLGLLENRALVRQSYGELMGVDIASEKPDLGFSGAVARAANEGAERFIEDVAFDGAGTFRALLTEPSTWVSPQLASFYGLSAAAAGGDESVFQKVQRDPQRYAGLFSQPAYLVGSSFGANTSPVHRSLPILTKVLCYQPPPPPADVAAVTPVEEPSAATTRERLTHFTADPKCMSCHRDINPIGFAFENFDAVGKWRDAENGTPIDASGVLTRSDAAGPFANAVELMQHIAESDDAKACFVTQWMQQAYRRTEEPTDACTKAELTRAFADSDGKIVELLAALAQTDNFRYRLKSELQP